jgi:hypothetical protein
MFGMFGGGFGGGPGRFEAHYRCYPVSFIDKPEAERGDKIFMPPSALDRLGTHLHHPSTYPPPPTLQSPHPRPRSSTAR